MLRMLGTQSVTSHRTGSWSNASCFHGDEELQIYSGEQLWKLVHHFLKKRAQNISETFHFEASLL